MTTLQWVFQMFLFLHSKFISIIVITSSWNQTLTWREESLILKLFIAGTEILKQISRICLFTQQIHPALMPDVGVGTVVRAANRTDRVLSTRTLQQAYRNIPLPWPSRFCFFFAFTDPVCKASDECALWNSLPSCWRGICVLVITMLSSVGFKGRRSVTPPMRYIWLLLRHEGGE